LNFIYKCSQLLQDEETEEICQNHLLKEANDLSESLAASILFILTQNPEIFIDQRKIDSPKLTIIPNQSIGGLLLMHPLHAVSSLPVVPLHLREMFLEHLAWIGDVMGIGHASLLADVGLHFFF
jgi:hypothetical protein